MSDKKLPDPAQELILRTQEAGEEQKRLTTKHLEEIEEGIFLDSLRNVSAALDFGKIDPKRPKKVPEEWRKLSKKQQEERMRVANYGRLPAAETPFGLRLSTQILTAALSARAKRVENTREFRADHASLPTPAPVYPVIDESSDEDE